jgi:hypothetical protein
MENNYLFNTPKTKSAISRAIDTLTNINDSRYQHSNDNQKLGLIGKKSSSVFKERNEAILLILKSMQSEPDIWNQNCGTNIEWIGSSLISKLEDVSLKTSNGELDAIFASCYRFLLEYYLSSPNELNHEYEQIRLFALENLESFENEAQGQIKFAAYFMPLSIFKKSFTNENVVNVKTFNQISLTSEKKLSDWNTEIQNSENRVTQLKEILKQHQTAFNFVGLYEGFNQMSNVKNEERDKLTMWVRIAGLSILFPIALDFFLVFYNVNSIENLQRVALISFIPMISVVAIMIYFFRVLLHNLNEVKAQLLQIELRKTLCQFIQSYVEYSNEMKNKDSESLSKFENIIFSGLVSSSEKLPSTFDGLEQLTNIIQAIRKSN